MQAEFAEPYFAIYPARSYACCLYFAGLEPRHNLLYSLLCRFDRKINCLSASNCCIRSGGPKILTEVDRPTGATNPVLRQ